MGAIMGPTIVRQRFQVDAGGGAPVKLMQKILSILEPLEKKIPPFKLDAASARAHLDKYKEWLQAFMLALGYKKELNNYVALHILRKHVLAQTIAASNDRLAQHAADAEEQLQKFSSRVWFDSRATLKDLRELVPDEAEYLVAMAGVLKPWKLFGAHPCRYHDARVGFT